MQLSQMLRKMIRDRNLSLSKLSKASGVSAPTLHGWQNGRGVQDLDALKKVAAVLQISVHELLYGEPDPFESKSDQIIEHLFTGDLRISISKIKNKSENK